MTYQPLHAPTDDAKLQSMINTLNNGQELPPVVVLPCGIQAITGSHRIAAYSAVGMDCPAIIMTEEEYVAACASAGVEYLDDLGHNEDVIAAVRAAATRTELLAALDGQDR